MSDRLGFYFKYDDDLKITSLSQIHYQPFGYQRYGKRSSNNAYNTILLKDKNTNILSDHEFLKGYAPKSSPNLYLRYRQEIYKYIWGNQSYQSH
jgi:hypothetical protein